MQFEELHVAFAEVEVHQPLVAGDAVLLVHHRIADLQLGQVAQPVVERGLALRRVARASCRAAGVQLGFGDEGKLFEQKSVVQGCHAEREFGVAGQKAWEVAAGRGFQAVFVEQVGERFAPSGRFGEQQNAPGKAVDKGFQARERVVGAALDGYRGDGSRRAIGAGVQNQSCVGLGGNEERLFSQKQIGGRQQRPALFAGEHVEARLRIAPESADRLGNVVVQAQHRVFRQVVEQRCRFVKEQRQPVFDAGRRDAGGDVLVDFGARRVAFKALAEALAEMRAPLVVEREFARRQQAYFRHRVQRALRVHVEGLDALDFVVKEIEPVRQLRAHRKKIDQPAADRIFAGRHHLCDVRVTGQRQLGAEGLGVELLAVFEEKGISRQISRRGKAIGGRRRRHQQHVAFAAHDAVERRQPFRNEIVVRRKAVVRQRFPVRQQTHAQTGCKPRDFIEQTLRIVGARRQYGEQRVFAGLKRQLRDLQRVRRAGKGRQHGAFARLDRRHGNGQLRSRDGGFRLGLRHGKTG